MFLEIAVRAIVIARSMAAASGCSEFFGTQPSRLYCRLSDSQWKREGKLRVGSRIR